MEESLVQFMEVRKEQIKKSSLKTTESDEDQMFLLSLLPRLKKLSAERKAYVQMKFTQVLYEVEFQMEKQYHNEDVASISVENTTSFCNMLSYTNL